MDAQRKKGILEVCVLAVLKKGPSYGYLIIRELESCIEISESTLYPILKRLEQNGSLKTYRREYNGRMRKYYQLTEEGQNKIDQFLDEWDELQNMYRFVEVQNQMEPVMQEAEENTADEKDVEDTAVDGTAVTDEADTAVDAEGTAAMQETTGAEHTADRTDSVDCNSDAAEEGETV